MNNISIASGILCTTTSQTTRQHSVCVRARVCVCVCVCDNVCTCVHAIMPVCAHERVAHSLMPSSLPSSSATTTTNRCSCCHFANSGRMRGMKSVPPSAHREGGPIFSLAHRVGQLATCMLPRCYSRQCTGCRAHLQTSLHICCTFSASSGYTRSRNVAVGGASLPILAPEAAEKCSQNHDEGVYKTERVSVRRSPCLFWVCSSGPHPHQ